MFWLLSFKNKLFFLFFTTSYNMISYSKVQCRERAPFCALHGFFACNHTLMAFSHTPCAIRDQSSEPNLDVKSLLHHLWDSPSFWVLRLVWIQEGEQESVWCRKWSAKMMRCASSAQGARQRKLAVLWWLYCTVDWISFISNVTSFIQSEKTIKLVFLRRRQYSLRIHHSLLQEPQPP